jgi:hypothetical protein
MLNVIDEFTHECLAIRVARKLKAIDVIDVLSDLFILRGVPGHVRSDNGPECVAEAVQAWITAVGAKTASVERGSPGRTATSRASTRACVTSCSMARSSIPSEKLKSSSKGLHINFLQIRYNVFVSRSRFIMKQKTPRQHYFSLAEGSRKHLFFCIRGRKR